MPTSAGAFAPGQEQAPRALRESGLLDLLATHGNGFRLSRRFRAVRICDRLPLVATARLHKCSNPAPRP